MASRILGLLIDITPLRISPAFRRVFAARAISLIGIGMLLVSVPVQMWELTGSSLQVGAATAVAGFATFGGMLLGGVLADRFDRRLLILTGRSAAALAFAGLALNAFGVFGGTPLVWVLYALAAFDGLIGALSAAALMAAVPTLIPREHLAAVGALGSLTVRIGTTVAPGLAGAIIGIGGVRWTYTVAAALATVTVLVLLRLPSLPPDAELADDTTDDGPASTDDRPALPAFFRSTPVVLSVMAIGTVTMLAAGLVALLPALVTDRFDDRPGLVGYLLAAAAAGALLATLTSGWIGRAARPGTLLLAATLIGCVLLIPVGLSGAFWFTLLTMLAIGFTDATAEVLRYMLIQQHTPGPLLGRVNSIWMAQEVSGVTVGALVAGAFGILWVAPSAIVFFGIALTALAGVAVAALPTLRVVRRYEALRAESVVDQST